VCCAVALRNIQIIEDEDLVARAASLGAHLARKLQPLLALSGVGHVRSQGLMAAVELVADKSTKTLYPADRQVSPRVNEALFERGLATRVLYDCVCLAPPLITSEAQIEQGFIDPRADLAVSRI